MPKVKLTVQIEIEDADDPQSRAESAIEWLKTEAEAFNEDADNATYKVLSCAVEPL